MIHVHVHVAGSSTIDYGITGLAYCVLMSRYILDTVLELGFLVFLEVSVAG